MPKGCDADTHAVWRKESDMLAPDLIAEYERAHPEIHMPETWEGQKKGRTTRAKLAKLRGVLPSDPEPQPAPNKGRKSKGKKQTPATDKTACVICCCAHVYLPKEEMH